MMFSLTDLREMLGSLRWFLGRGPRPEYGRWTYWEKFDYFAVFWGVAVIGLSGLLLWFPTFFTNFMPGWFLNLATIIHSDEALLAVGFIFTVHFFNTHFRPEKFPMDTVIFTGGIPLEEFKQDRPREYAAMIASGRLEEHLMPAPDPRDVRRWRAFGWVALSLGIGLVVLIRGAELLIYRGAARRRPLDPECEPGRDHTRSRPGARITVPLRVGRGGISYSAALNAGTPFVLYVAKSHFA